MTEEEIKALVDEGADSGAIEHIEHEIVDRVFSLGDKRALNLMTHRSNIVWLDIDDDYEVHRETILASGHTVYPVCQGGLDNITGMVHIKSLLNQYLVDEPIRLDRLTQPLNYVHENSSAYSILNKFKEGTMREFPNKRHIPLSRRFGIVEQVMTKYDDCSDGQDYIKR